MDITGKRVEWDEVVNVYWRMFDSITLWLACALFEHLLRAISKRKDWRFVNYKPPLQISSTWKVSLFVLTGSLYSYTCRKGTHTTLNHFLRLWFHWVQTSANIVLKDTGWVEDGVHWAPCGKLWLCCAVPHEWESLSFPGPRPQYTPS